ncbi:MULTISPECIES: hypothetical protein [unclassified Pseudomonas]|uniref:hypothetical protein n=1 Tax=unclassified Pseudomonas TaxID=196821 RepID=UPI000D34165B|nr:MULTISPECIES: hypothetical protein [unclassified Pseudomonas]RAU45794.1 hypothetical protein DBP26_012505 [Pseudomonas sp. RIT 409]RAU56107.1 hypothetical protein DBY65_002990 [Pseudomonas sp. RIT 412]
MKKQNEVVSYKGEVVIQALCEIEYILISLGDMGSYYYLHPDRPPTPETDLEYALETTRFIDENGICDRLNKVRSILCEPFDHGVGDDDMDDIERVVDKLKFWRKPGD